MAKLPRSIEPSLPGERLDAVGTEQVGLNEVLGEADAADRAGAADHRRRLDDGDRETAPRQPDGRRQPRTAGPHDHHVVLRRTHPLNSKDELTTNHTNHTNKRQMAIKRNRSSSLHLGSFVRFYSFLSFIRVIRVIRGESLYTRAATG